MGKSSDNKHNLDYLKQLTNDLCQKLNNSKLENKYSEKINTIKKILSAKNYEKPEKLLQQIEKIVNQANE